MKSAAPAAAGRKYVCSTCSHIYDEASGEPEAGIAPGTRWEDIPDDWVCPVCGVAKTEFREMITADQATD
ncbi:MAG TPA: rubredoxin [Burkholderiales bacterium]|nr:rubredoxin [Burkholderiales bacterium]